MIITAPFTHTSQSRKLINDIDNAELLGQSFKDFFTGEDCEYYHKHTVSLKRDGEWKYFSYYSKGRESLLQGWKLREALENRIKELQVAERESICNG